jgi:hypothetical protein
MLEIFEATRSQISTGFEIFLLLYFVCVVAMYIVFFSTGRKFMIPGDYYKVKPPRVIYFPFSSSMVLASIIFIIVKSKIIFLVITLLAIYFIYRVVVKKNL